MTRLNSLILGDKFTIVSKPDEIEQPYPFLFECKWPNLNGETICHSPETGTVAIDAQRVVERANGHTNFMCSFLAK